MFRQILTLAGLGLLLALCAGCGSNDNGGTNPPPVTAIRVQVAQPSTSPSTLTVTDAVWNTITPTQIDITQSIFAKLVVSGVSSLSDSVKVQAARHNDSLWIRLQWTDNTNNIWRGSYKVVDTAHVVGSDTIVQFRTERDSVFEDQAFLLFGGLGPNLRDVWNWRALTTGAGRLAEGMSVLTDTTPTGPDTLVVQEDALTIPNLAPAYSNYASIDYPANVHKDTSEFNGAFLYLEDLQQVFATTSGWHLGQRVPGYYIDSALYLRPAAERGSRWDIRTASKYDSSAHQYTVVMVCPMHTSYSDDLDFTTVDSVQTQVGLYDNEILLSAGSFTKKFWLIF